MQEKYQLEIKINSFPKSLNKKLRSHWGKNHKENREWDNVIFFALLRKLPPSPLTKAHLKITRHHYRTLDFDGLVGSLKPVVDALVSCGVLKDDSWNVLHAWEIDQVFRSKKDGALLQIEIKEL